MTYVIVTGKRTVVSAPLASFADALDQAFATFGKDVPRWLDLNLRIEECR
jgi:hypothetical protein